VVYAEARKFEIKIKNKHKFMNKFCCNLLNFPGGGGGRGGQNYPHQTIDGSYHYLKLI